MYFCWFKHFSPAFVNIMLGVVFIMSKDMKFQRKLVKELKSNKEFAYQDASIYTILLDLIEGNGVEEVFVILHNVATDLKKRKELESQFEKVKGWEWA